MHGRGQDKELMTRVRTLAVDPQQENEHRVSHRVTLSSPRIRALGRRQGAGRLQWHRRCLSVPPHCVPRTEGVWGSSLGLVRSVLVRIDAAADQGALAVSIQKRAIEGIVYLPVFLVGSSLRLGTNIVS